MVTTDISNSDDVIDSRNVIARFDELMDERTALIDAVNDATDEEEKSDAAEEVASWNDENKHEFDALESLIQDAEGSPDWQYGEALIRDSYFEDYARQLAEDIGAIDPKANWPLNCIDWEQAASELQVDYMSVDFDGVTYWIRA